MCRCGEMQGVHTFVRDASPEKLRVDDHGVRRALGRAGAKASGDLLPWTVAQQFQDPGFASLSGARVVRIATHPARFFADHRTPAALHTHMYTRPRPGHDETNLRFLFPEWTTS